MAQAGRLVVCGDAGDALGDSLYEARLYVRGAVAGLGADCIEKEMRDEHLARCTTCSSARRSTTSIRRTSAATARHGSSTHSRSTTQERIDDRHPPRHAARLRRRPGLRESALFDRNVIAEIQRAAREGIYDIRGFGAKRHLPHFDDLLFLGASISRYPSRAIVSVATRRHARTRHARTPLELKIPITIAGMSFGALSAPGEGGARPRRGEVGTSTTTATAAWPTPTLLVYQLLPSRYGMNPDDLQRADAIEVVIARRLSRAAAGTVLGREISDRVRRCARCPRASISAARAATPTGTGRTMLKKIGKLRELTDWQKPIFVKVGATRTYYDVALAVKAGADVVVVDGMQGGTAATQDVFIEHVGIPTLPAVPLGGRVPGAATCTARCS